MKKQFGHFAGFLFSDHLVVLCSGGSSAIELTREGFDRMSALFRDKPDLAGLFINEYQPLAHLLFTDIDDMLVQLDHARTPEWPCSPKGSGWAPTGQLENTYLTDNLRIGGLIPPGDTGYFRTGLLAGIQARAQVFSLLKKRFTYGGPRRIRRRDGAPRTTQENGRLPSRPEVYIASSSRSRSAIITRRPCAAKRNAPGTRRAPSTGRSSTSTPTISRPTIGSGCSR